MKNIGILTDEKRAQINNFIKKSNRYINFLCYCYSKPPMITKEDLLSVVYERLCIYAVRHNIGDNGKKLAEYLVRTAHSMLIDDKYHNNVTIVNDDFFFDNLHSYDLNSVEDKFEYEHNSRIIEIKLSTLKDFERRYIIEYYINGKTMSEIAKLNNVSTQYVSSIIKQSMTKIIK